MTPTTTEHDAVKGWLARAGFRWTMGSWAWEHPNRTHVLMLTSEPRTFGVLAVQLERLCKLKWPLGGAAQRFRDSALAAGRAWLGDRKQA